VKYFAAKIRFFANFAQFLMEIEVLEKRSFLAFYLNNKEIVDFCPL